jgi:sodium/potassium-transporting ATPase subunit alpha
MKKMPRNAKTDRLVTTQVVLYAYLQAGAIQVCAGYLAFFLVFKYYGMSSGSLFNTPYFTGVGDNPMPTFPGCETLDNAEGPYTVGNVCYDGHDQNEILYQAQTAYYAMLVSCQVFHVWFCKTRNLNVWEHGLFRNEFTIWGVALEICIIILVIFPPSSNTIFFSRPFPARFWALIVIAPFVLGVWQEGRKYYVKKHPQSWVARNLHW